MKLCQTQSDAATGDRRVTSSSLRILETNNTKSASLLQDDAERIFERYIEDLRDCTDPSCKYVPLHGKLIGTFALLFVSLFLMVASLVVGRGFVPLKENPMLGPSVNTLLTMGGLRSTLVRSGDWWRLIWAGYLHAGWFHILMNFALWYKLGVMVEPDWGFLRTTLVFNVSVLSGNLLSATLDPYHVSVGASGGIFGIMGACVPYVVEYWHTIRNPRLLLYVVIASLVLGLLSGFLPYVDNYAHMGGALGGILSGFMFISKVEMGTAPPKQRKFECRYTSQRFTSLSRKLTPYTQKSSITAFSPTNWKSSLELSLPPPLMSTLEPLTDTVQGDNLVRTADSNDCFSATTKPYSTNLSKNVLLAACEMIPPSSPQQAYIENDILQSRRIPGLFQENTFKVVDTLSAEHTRRSRDGLQTEVLSVDDNSENDQSSDNDDSEVLHVDKNNNKKTHQYRIESLHGAASNGEEKEGARRGCCSDLEHGEGEEVVPTNGNVNSDSNASTAPEVVSNQLSAKLEDSINSFKVTKQNSNSRGKSGFVKFPSNAVPKKNCCCIVFLYRIKDKLRKSLTSNKIPCRTTFRSVRLNYVDDSFRWKDKRVWIVRIIAAILLIIFWIPLFYFLLICPECYTAPGQIISVGANRVSKEEKNDQKMIKAQSVENFNIPSTNTFVKDYPIEFEDIILTPIQLKF